MILEGRAGSARQPSARIARSRCGVSLFGLQVLAVIAGFNALGPPQRGIVEVDPGGRRHARRRT